SGVIWIARLQAGPASHIGLGGNRETASVSKCLFRNLQSWSGLLTLIFAALHHSYDTAHQIDGKAALGCNLLGGTRVLHVVLQDCVQHLVRRKTITVF